MAAITLTPVTTNTTISSTAYNANLTALTNCLNYTGTGTGLNGANLSPGAVGAPWNSDLASHIAGSGLVLTANQLAVSGLTHTNLSNTAGITQSQLSTSTLTALAPQATSNGLLLVVSNTNPSTNQLGLIRGSVGATGTVAAGEGFSVVNASAGVYNITFTTAFLATDVPVVVGSFYTVPSSSNESCVFVSAATYTGCQITTFVNGASANAAFTFFAAGQLA